MECCARDTEELLQLGLSYLPLASEGRSVLTRHDMRVAIQGIVAELEAIGIILDATGDRMSRYLLDMLLEECNEVIWRLSDDDAVDTSEAVVNPGIDHCSDRQP